LIIERPEISEIFEEYVNDESVINAEALHTFFVEEQGENNINVNDVIQLYEENETRGMISN